MPTLQYSPHHYKPGMTIIFQCINTPEIKRPVIVMLLDYVQKLYRTKQSEPFVFQPKRQDRIVL